MKGPFIRCRHIALVLSTILTSATASAAMFGIGTNVDGLPPVVLEADYDYYGETGTLSKLRNRHLRPPYSLPVSTVAIIDDLNEKLDKKGAKAAPKVVITDRLQWGRFELFSVLRPVGDGQKISTPTPVICKSKYDCKVDYAFEDRLSQGQRAMLAWTRYYLAKNHGSRRLNNQQSARVTAEYQLFSVNDARSVSSPAINFWLNLENYPENMLIQLDQPQNGTLPDAVKAVDHFVRDLQAMDSSELTEQSFSFNQLMEKHLQSLFAGQYTYPWTLVKTSTAGYTSYERKDLSALELAAEVRNWQQIQAHGYIRGKEINYLILSLNGNIEDIHILPVHCKADGCNQLNWEQLRNNATRLLNHPSMLQQFSRYLSGF